MEIFVGIDCGGTSLRIGVFDKKGHLLSHSKSQSPLVLQADEFGKIIKNELDLMIESNDQGPDWSIQAIGVGTPGPIDIEKGLVFPSPNLRNLQPIDLKSQLESTFPDKKIKFFFDRDTNVALLGEIWQGEARIEKDVVMLTIGTGVGGAIAINGKVYRGLSGKAGEIGHMFVEISPKKSFLKRSIPKCGLGHIGCLEALINQARSLEDLGMYLGYGLASVVDILSPTKIIIGGGKVNQGDFVSRASRVMREQTINKYDNIKVVLAGLGDLSGVYGAAYLAMEEI